MNDRIVEIWSDQDHINIRISHADLLTLAEKHNENPLKVVKISQFLKEYIRELTSYVVNTDVDYENEIEHIIDECIQRVYESGSDSVEEMMNPDTGMLYDKYKNQ